MLELLVCELFLRLGWTIEAHPDLPATSRHPDFLALRDGQSVFVEVTTVEPYSVFSEDPLEAQVLDIIDDLESPNFFLFVETSGKLTSLPRLSSWRSAIKRFVDLHNPDEVTRHIDAHGFDSAPRAAFKHESWQLTVRLSPKSESGRGKPGRSIGAGPVKGGFIDTSTPVREAILDKARRYRDLHSPYLIVVNAPQLDDRIDEMNALFGREQFTVDLDNLDAPAIMSREPNGVWVTNGDRPRKPEVSGVLIFRGIAPWSLSSGHWCLYENPHPHYPLPSGLERLPRAVVANGRMTWHEGERVSDILGLKTDYLTLSRRRSARSGGRQIYLSDDDDD